MPITNTQDVFNIRSIDTVHIGPSILEGRNLYSSILGPDRAVELVRYAPTNLVPPSIFGDFRIPSLLTCNPGVWDAAPSPNYLYQWREDGVDIDGATSNTFTTYAALDGKAIDCVVTAVNNQGFVVITAPPLVVELIEPIIAQEFDVMIVTGQASDSTGLVNQNRVYFVVGVASDTQTQNHTSISMVVSGLPLQDQMLSYISDVYVVTTTP